MGAFKGLDDVLNSCFTQFVGSSRINQHPVYGRLLFLLSKELGGLWTTWDDKPRSPGDE